MTQRELFQQLDRAGLHHPQLLTIAITDTCNLTCRHCWVSAGEASSGAHVPLWSLYRLLKEFAAIGGEGIRITGGEPLCHPHWLEVIKILHSLGFKTVVVQTNAVLLRDEHVAALRELNFPGLSIQVSLDGATAGTHDLVRGEGAFAATMDGILKLVQGGLAGSISIFFTEMRHNLEEIPELLHLADRLGLIKVSTGAMVLCGRASEQSLVVSPEVKQYLELVERYDKDPHFRDLYGKIGNVAAVEWSRGDAIRHECCTFIGNPYITPAGTIFPCLLCHTDQFSVSGAYQKGLVAALTEGVPLWSSLLNISCKRAAAIPDCPECPGKVSCAGGCMGRAWGSRGDLMAADDRCSVRRAIYQSRTK